jgi:hypothetical protein
MIIIFTTCTKINNDASIQRGRMHSEIIFVKMMKIALALLVLADYIALTLPLSGYLQH